MKCRFCSSQEMTEVIDLGMHPPSNSFVKEKDLDKGKKYYPLVVCVCRNCWLMQTMDFVDKSEIFNDQYPYYSGQSAAWIKHCEAFADEAIDKFDLNKNSRILEVASNDGTGLIPFKKLDCFLVGVDPALGPAGVAEGNGIHTIPVFFNYNLVENVSNKYDLIIARNVVAHVPDINDFMDAIAMALSINGHAVFEFPSLQNLLNDCQFDTIYHEHFSYLSLFTFKQIVERAGMYVNNCEKIWTHGGSYRVTVSFGQNVDSRVQEILLSEYKFGVNRIEPYREFKIRALEIKKTFLSWMLKNCDDYDIIGYGAAAKASTFLNYCGIGRDLLPFIVDSSPYKCGLYMPGSNIPIIEEDAISSTSPDYIIIFPWNFTESIINRLSYHKQNGCKFITFIPKIMVV